jgi:predicted RNA methylase
MRSPHPRELSALAAEMAETGVDLEKDPQLAAVIAVNLSTDLSVK